MPAGSPASIVRTVFLVTILFVLVYARATAQTNVLLPAGSVWKFIDDAVLEEGWQVPEFDDSSWNAGGAPLGYGEPLTIATPTANGSQTNYFRHSFSLTGIATVSNLTFRLWRDD